MSIITYVSILLATALISWVIWLFIWKHYHRKDPYYWYWDKDLLCFIGIFGCLLGSTVWPVTLPAACLVGIGYLLYRLIIKD